MPLPLLLLLSDDRQSRAGTFIETFVLHSLTVLSRSGVAARLSMWGDTGPGRVSQRPCRKVAQIAVLFLFEFDLPRELTTGCGCPIIHWISSLTFDSPTGICHSDHFCVSAYISDESAASLVCLKQRKPGRREGGRTG